MIGILKEYGRGWFPFADTLPGAGCGLSGWGRSARDFRPGNALPVLGTGGGIAFSRNAS